MRIHVTNTDTVIEFDEGTGDNLLDEDIEAGYVDYVYYTVYDISDLFNVVEVDGGMILLEEYYDEHYTETYTLDGKEYSYFDNDAVARDALDMAGYDRTQDYTFI